jgi:hypothetical protein
MSVKGLSAILLAGVVLGGSAHARDFNNCPIYPAAPPPTAPVVPGDPPKTGRVKTTEETFQKTQGSGSADASVVRAVINWNPYWEEAQKKALGANRVYAMYFCSEAAARVAGEGPEVWEKYKKNNPGNALQPTVFDSGVTVAEFNAAGIAEFIKVPNIPANAELFKQYEAAPNTLVLCAPNGDRLAIFPPANCTQTNVVHFLKTGLARYVDQWQKAQKEEEERSAAKRAAKEERESRVAALRAKKTESSSVKSRSSDAAVAKTLGEMDKAYTNLAEARKLNWNVPAERKDLNPAQDASLLLERVASLAKVEGIAEQPPAFLVAVYDTQTAATGLVATLRAFKKNGSPEEMVEDLNLDYRRLENMYKKLRR